MKKSILFIRVWVWLATIFFFTGCQSVATSSQAYYEVIPVNATSIISINAARLVEKSGAEQEVWNLIANEVQKEIKAEAGQKIGELLKQGKTAGIELQNKIYIFTTSENHLTGLVAKVADEGDLKKVFDLLASSGNMTKPVSANGYYYVTVPSGGVCIFDKDKLLFVNSSLPLQESRQLAEKLFREGNTNRAQNDVVYELVKEQNDIAVFFTKDNIPSYLKNQLLHSMPSGTDILDLKVLFTLNFDKGKIALVCKRLDSPEQNVLCRKQTNTFINFYPEATLFYAAMNIEGKKLYADIASFVEAEYQEQTEKILSAFDGDLTLGVTGMGPLGIPSLLLYAQVKNAQPAVLLAGMLKNNPACHLIEKGKNAYELQFRNAGRNLNMSLYFGVKDHIFYMTNGAESEQHLFDKLPDSFARSLRAPAIMNAFAGVYLNVEAWMGSPVVQLGLYQLLRTQTGFFQQMLNEVSYAEVLSAEEERSELNIYLKDTEQNALQTLVAKTRKLAGIK